MYVIGFYVVISIWRKIIGSIDNMIFMVNLVFFEFEWENERRILKFLGLDINILFRIFCNVLLIFG